MRDDTRLHNQERKEFNEAYARCLSPELTQGLTADQAYTLLSLGMSNPNSPNVGVTVAFVLLCHKRYEDFTRLTQALTAEQSYALLSSGRSDPKHSDVGMTVAWALLALKRYEDFTRLTHGLTAEQSYALLSTAPSNPNHPSAGETVAFKLVTLRRLEDFNRLTQGLTAEQSYALLSAGLNHRHFYAGQTVALRLLFSDHKGFTRLTQGLRPEQSYVLLSAAPSNPENPAAGSTLAIGLLADRRYEDFTRLTQGLTPEQSYALLSAGPSNPNDYYGGITLALGLLRQNRHEDFTRLTQGLTAEQSYVLLSAASSNPSHPGIGETVALVLLLQYPFEDFKRLTQNLSSEQTINIFRDVYKKRDRVQPPELIPNHLFTDQLLQQCHYEHLAEFYNSLPDNTFETRPILYRLFYLLSSSLTEIFENKIPAEGNEKIIKPLLSDLFEFFNELVQTNYKKTCIEQLAALMQLASSSDASHKACAESFLLLDLKEPTFCELYQYSSKNHSLKTFGFYFSCLSMNIDDSDHARILAKQYADDVKRAGTIIHSKSNSSLFFAPEESVKLPDEAAQKRIRDLEDEVRALREEKELLLIENKRLKQEGHDNNAEEPEVKKPKF